jgi:RNA polymerase sigma factor (sigma-70 family)
MDYTAALVKRTVNGDESAWETLVTMRGERLRMIARGYRLSAEEMADAIQETWLNAFLHLGDLRDWERFGAWLDAIMRSQCLRAISHRQRHAYHLVPDSAAMNVVDTAIDVEREVLATERSAILHRAVARLPERERQVIRELATDEPSYTQVSHRLSMPIGSVGPTRMRALRRLRVILEESYDRDQLVA